MEANIPGAMSRRTSDLPASQPSSCLATNWRCVAEHPKRCRLDCDGNGDGDGDGDARGDNDDEDVRWPVRENGSFALSSSRCPLVC
ncbi:hypothetical protein O9K51_00482 [Purpureocillium lavendulum]|uniref:Uncharacterized protein n=1 Tax=Purpureocillium lavendulum TaxID=1247861 RepID=A0AB34G2L3_9HYPO|nr:hypothetical protein O9K51_00482 [Purpureocillium lavendulum]